MAGEKKRKERQVLITKALLLGYEFDWIDRYRAWVLVKPGNRVHTKFVHKGDRSYGPEIQCYPARHLAAIEALKLSGVYDATKSSGDTGVGNGKNFRLRGRRRKRGGAGGFFEGTTPKP